MTKSHIDWYKDQTVSQSNDRKYGLNKDEINRAFSNTE